VCGEATRSFVSFQPAISKDAQNTISSQIRRWRLHRRIGYPLAEIARQINPVVRGCACRTAGVGFSFGYPVDRILGVSRMRSGTG
jgi:hypothetical protein